MLYYKPTYLHKSMNRHQTDRFINIFERGKQSDKKTDGWMDGWTPARQRRQYLYLKIGASSFTYTILFLIPYYDVIPKNSLRYCSDMCIYDIVQICKLR